MFWMRNKAGVRRERKCVNCCCWQSVLNWKIREIIFGKFFLQLKLEQSQTFALVIPNQPFINTPNLSHWVQPTPIYVRIRGIPSGMLFENSFLFDFQKEKNLSRFFQPRDSRVTLIFFGKTPYHEIIIFITVRCCRLVAWPFKLFFLHWINKRWKKCKQNFSCSLHAPSQHFFQFWSSEISLTHSFVMYEILFSAALQFFRKFEEKNRGNCVLW